MNTQTKNLHTGYRHNCTEIVVDGKVRKRVRKKGEPSFKEWVRSQPGAAGFFERRKQAR
jgi:hypothetical protein